MLYIVLHDAGPHSVEKQIVYTNNARWIILLLLWQVTIFQLTFVGENLCGTNKIH